MLCISSALEGASTATLKCLIALQVEGIQEATTERHRMVEDLRNRLIQSRTRMDQLKAKEQRLRQIKDTLSWWTRRATREKAEENHGLAEKEVGDLTKEQKKIKTQMALTQLESEAGLMKNEALFADVFDTIQSMGAQDLVSEEPFRLKLGPVPFHSGESEQTVDRTIEGSVRLILTQSISQGQLIGFHVQTMSKEEGLALFNRSNLFLRRIHYQGPGKASIAHQPQDKATLFEIDEGEIIIHRPLDALLPGSISALGDPHMEETFGMFWTFHWGNTTENEIFAYLTALILSGKLTG